MISRVLTFLGISCKLGVKDHKDMRGLRNIRTNLSLIHSTHSYFYKRFPQPGDFVENLRKIGMR